MDAVFTWVDGGDPEHLAKRQAYARDAKMPGVHKRADVCTRFSDNGELWFAVNLLRQNAPWIDTIYVVTDQQCPSWLNAELQQTLGVRIVDHKEIFNGYEDCLPIFNSMTIEAMLWRIPGLSERFVYFNDDFFVLRPVSEKDFFLEGKAVFRGEWVSRNKFLKKIRKLFWPHSRGLVGSRAEVDKLGLNRYFSLAHTPYALTRSMLKNVFSDEESLRQHCFHRYRNSQQMWPIGYVANVSLLAGESLQGRKNWECIGPEGLSEREIESIADQIRRSGHIQFLCIQSLDLASPGARKTLLGLLEDFMSSAVPV